MRTRLAGALALILAATACGSNGDASAATDTAAAAAPTAATATEAPASAAAPATTTASESAVSPDLAVLIAAVNEGLEGTSYENAPLDDPEVFIGVGQLFCELLTEGMTIDEVLAEYLTALEDSEGGAVDDDALVSGVLMGASLEVLCPEHKEAA